MFKFYQGLIKDNSKSKKNNIGSLIFNKTKLILSTYDKFYHRKTNMNDFVAQKIDRFEFLKHKKKKYPLNPLNLKYVQSWPLRKTEKN